MLILSLKQRYSTSHIFPMLFEVSTHPPSIKCPSMHPRESRFLYANQSVKGFSWFHCENRENVFSVSIPTWNLFSEIHFGNDFTNFTKTLAPKTEIFQGMFHTIINSTPSKFHVKAVTISVWDYQQCIVDLRPITWMEMPGLWMVKTVDKITVELSCSQKVHYIITLKTLIVSIEPI